VAPNILIINIACIPVHANMHISVHTQSEKHQLTGSQVTPEL